MAGAPGALSVIALISGGKDSFYSILHCQANGHRVVALANLYPPGTGEITAATEQRTDQNEASSPERQMPVSPSGPSDGRGINDAGETDLNSFMYQTVGHQIIPLYARATGLPLYRQPIVGTAVHHGLSYDHPSRLTLGPSDGQLPPAIHDSQGFEERPAHDEEHGPGPEPEPEPEDETESLIPLLRTVLNAHPEANALCTGAILSTYQRTRVESVALRLGLVPLSYLWQFTELPVSVPSGRHDQGISPEEKIARRRARGKGLDHVRDDARLLRDMADVGLEARVVKVASAGLDEGFLWENVASDAGVRRMERAMRRFGAAGSRGSILGEGGEFETLVLNGPSSLFKGRVVVSDENKRVIREGGGCAWLSFRRADVVLKDGLERAGESQAGTLDLKIPELLGPRFEDVRHCLLAMPPGDLGLTSITGPNPVTDTGLPTCQQLSSLQSGLSQEWCYLGSDGGGSLTAEEQTVSIVDQIRRRLTDCSLPATTITNSVIVLRRMSDFPLVNAHYGSLFHESNPPSRVTISCGNETLPKDAAIAVYLTVQLRLQPRERRGLHVQSRSYWAPANIGPYSQAIGFPLLPRPTLEAEAGDHDEDGTESEEHSHMLSSPLAVSIAGQIPLLPASMVLPPPSTPDYVELQITLALQHLWRVGIEMQVRWWTSAMAYFPAASSIEMMQHRALLAAAAWKAAHLWPDIDDDNEYKDEHDVSGDDDAGPDLWDQRYNAQFMTYGGDETESFPLSLPNWNALKGSITNVDDAALLLRNKAANLPFFFAAEVEELPRQAGVEWHAHLGLADLRAGSVTLYSTIHSELSSPELGLLELSLHHVIVDSGDAVFVQTAATLKSSVDHDQIQKAWITMEVLRSLSATTGASLAGLFSMPSRPSMKPKITYAGVPQLADDYNVDDIGAIVPCRSLWDAQGRRLHAVSIFETRVAKTK